MKVKLLMIFAISIIGGGGMVLALRSNPTGAEAARAYSTMKLDFDKIIAHEDEILRSSGNSKYGGAYLTKSIRWGGRTYSNYAKKAVELGWWRLPFDMVQYCKDEILLTVKPDGRLSTGENVLYMEMSFDAASKRICRGEER